ncbi:MAG: holo-ACP synthase [Micrococcales bacterium]|nr:MAG: holo-ACP synthase [Micrococcales bacterium]PIE27348.1 MAG: holo-ACP synthase [Micrococcales bacterium]
MIVGIGIDVVDVARFSRLCERVPQLLDRVLVHAERVDTDGRPRRIESLAARFAAKEAVAKALGVPADMRWHDTQIRVAAAGQPVVDMTGTVRAAAAERGVTALHLSLSHDGGVATAFVIAEGDPSC